MVRLPDLQEAFREYWIAELKHTHACMQLGASSQVETFHRRAVLFQERERISSELCQKWS
jgi:hypothetical protein